jgi:hypothetical protein
MCSLAKKNVTNCFLVVINAQAFVEKFALNSAGNVTKLSYS